MPIMTSTYAENNGSGSTSWFSVCILRGRAEHTVVDLSHIQKQFEELEASMTPGERAERDRKHEEVLERLVKREERMLAPFLKMERLLAPYSDLEQVRACAGLAREMRSQAEFSLIASSLAEAGGIGELTKAFGGAAEAIRELSQVGELRKSVGLALDAAGGVESSFSDLVRKMAHPESIGLTTQELLTGCHGEVLSLQLEAIRQQEQLFRGALSSRSVIEEALGALEGRQALESAPEQGIEFDASKMGLRGVDQGDSNAATGLEHSDDGEEAVIEVPEQSPPGTQAKRSLKERRLDAYQVLREDIQLAAAEGGFMLDEMILRAHVLLVTMEREAEGGLY